MALCLTMAKVVGMMVVCVIAHITGESVSIDLQTLSTRGQGITSHIDELHENNTTDVRSTLTNIDTTNKAAVTSSGSRIHTTAAGMVTASNNIDSTIEMSSIDITTELPSTKLSRIDTTTELPSTTLSRIDTTTELPSTTLSRIDTTTELPSTKLSRIDTTTELPSTTLSGIDTTTELPSTTLSDIDTTTELPSTTLSDIDTTTELPITTLFGIDITTELPSTTLSGIDTTTELPSTTLPGIDITTELPSTTLSDIDNTTEVPSIARTSELYISKATSEPPSESTLESTTDSPMSNSSQTDTMDNYTDITTKIYHTEPSTMDTSTDVDVFGYNTSSSNLTVIERGTVPTTVSDMINSTETLTQFTVINETEIYNTSSSNLTVIEKGTVTETVREIINSTETLIHFTVVNETEIYNTSYPPTDGNLTNAERGTATNGNVTDAVTDVLTLVTLYNNLTHTYTDTVTEVVTNVTEVIGVADAGSELNNITGSMMNVTSVSDTDTESTTDAINQTSVFVGGIGGHTDISENNWTSTLNSVPQSDVSTIPMEVNDDQRNVTTLTNETTSSTELYGPVTVETKNFTYRLIGSETSTQPSNITVTTLITTTWSQPLYIKFGIKSNWEEFCVKNFQKVFQDSLCRLMNAAGTREEKEVEEDMDKEDKERDKEDKKEDKKEEDRKEEEGTQEPYHIAPNKQIRNASRIVCEQVVFHELPCNETEGSGSKVRERRYIKDTIDVGVYVTDSRGYYSHNLTTELAELLKGKYQDDLFEGTELENAVLYIKLYGADREEDITLYGSHGGTRWRPSVGILLAIVFGVLAVVILAAFLVMHVVIQKRRRRMKKMRHSYENRYSIDTLQGLGMDNIQLTGIRMAANRWGYVNPALVIDDRDFNSNPLNFPALSSIVTAPLALDEEFMMLPNYISRVSDLPRGTEDKNRYANIIPVPETRVPLTPGSICDEVPNYINANFVRGYLCAPKSYIATQAPLENTREDFWRMVYAHKVQAILMLTALEENGSARCVEYWPNTDGGDTQRQFGEYEVALIKRDIRREWITSALRVTRANSKQHLDVYHFWLTSWPAQGLPDPKTILGFLLAARPYMEQSIGPTVVHCSPGTGRTGVLLATDIQMLAYDDAKLVDILSCVCGLRQDRAGLVQTRDQYKFIYKAVLEYAQALHSSSRNPSLTSSVNSVNMHT